MSGWLAYQFLSPLEGILQGPWCGVDPLAAAARWALNRGMTLVAYVSAALAEIAGCFAFWAWARLEQPVWWLIPGMASLTAFAWFLTLVEVDAAGQAYAAYGGIYIAASLGWLGWSRAVSPTAGTS
jgi:small multidrug resistance family-3 protein